MANGEIAIFVCVRPRFAAKFDTMRLHDLNPASMHCCVNIFLNIKPSNKWRDLAGFGLAETRATSVQARINLIALFNVAEKDGLAF